METLLSLLAFAAFIAFIIGMIKPGLVVFWSKKKSRGMASLYIAAFFVFCIILGIISPETNTASVTPTSSAVSSSAVTSKAKSKETVVSSKVSAASSKVAKASVSKLVSSSAKTSSSANNKIDAFVTAYNDTIGKMSTMENVLVVSLSQPNDYRFTIQNRSKETITEFDAQAIVDSGISFKNSNGSLKKEKINSGYIYNLKWPVAIKPNSSSNVSFSMTDEISGEYDVYFSFGAGDKEISSDRDSTSGLTISLMAE